MSKKTKAEQRQRRIKSINKKLQTSNALRLNVFRSNKYIYAQLVDDSTHSTVVSSSSKVVKSKGKPMDVAASVGEDIGKKAIEKGVEKVVFDRRGYKYHGKVKALADGARKSGLKF